MKDYVYCRSHVYDIPNKMKLQGYSICGCMGLRIRIHSNFYRKCENTSHTFCTCKIYTIISTELL